LNVKYNNEKFRLHNDSIIISELLIEAGEPHHKLTSLSKGESDKVISKIGELVKLHKVIDSELNPFRKLEISKTYYKEIVTYFEVDPDYKGLSSNYSKFLDEIKVSECGKILIVGHASTLLGDVEDGMWSEPKERYNKVWPSKE
jgi:hypothetical protein